MDPAGNVTRDLTNGDTMKIGLKSEIHLSLSHFLYNHVYSSLVETHTDFSQDTLHVRYLNMCRYSTTRTQRFEYKFAIIRT